MDREKLKELRDHIEKVLAEDLIQETNALPSIASEFYHALRGLENNIFKKGFMMPSDKWLELELKENRVFFFFDSFSNCIRVTRVDNTVINPPMSLDEFRIRIK